MYYQAEGCMNMETITFEEESQGGYYSSWLLLWLF